MVGEQQQKRPLILIHGLWMRGWVMRVLGRRLSADGHWQAHYFDYPTRRRAPADNGRELLRFVRALDAGPVDIVAHSLGGIVLTHALQQGLAAYLHRAVFLASPLQGNRVAKRIDRWPLLGDWLLGQSRQQGLLGGAPRPAEGAYAIVAGTLGLGLGTPLLWRYRPHDGLVLVAETTWPEGPKVQRVQSTHASILFSASVCQQVRAYLINGRFSDPPAA